MHLIRAIAFATAAAAAAPVPEDKDPRAQNKDLRAENEDLRERLAAAEAAVAAFRASSSFEDSVSKEVGQHRRLNSVCDCVRDCGVVSPKPTPEPADEPTPADKPETGVTLGSGAPELSRGPQLSSQGNEMLGILCALRDAPVDNSKPHLSGLFSQINQKTQLAFDAATKGKRLDFSSRPVHNSPRSHAADDYGRGCGGGKNNATMGCFFAPVDDAACAASRAPRSAAGAFRALAANWTRYEALAAFTEVLWRPSAAVRATTAAMRSALDLPAETRVALGVHVRRGDRVHDAFSNRTGFTMFDDAEWVDFFAQRTARGDVAVVLTQDDVLAAKLVHASAARGVRIVHVDAALRSAGLPFGQFLVAAVALLAEADVVAANSGSNMGRAAFVAAKRAARGLPAMFDFDGKWTAKDAARGYAPCKLQYYLSATETSGKKSMKKSTKKSMKVNGCPIPEGGHPLCSRVC